MPTPASKQNYVILSVAVASLAASVLGVSGWVSALAQEQPAAAQPDPQATSAPVAAAAPDPAVELEKKRDQTRSELDALSKTINLSSSKVAELQKSIEDLDKSTSSVRQALIDSAARRKSLEKQILESEKKLADLGVKEDAVRHSLHERRGLLAEVLAALQRMGRNPPPALLVTPDDALASVRSAILLGAVVPGIRKETDKLAADLGNLASLQAASAAEKAGLTTTMTNSLEEERRMDLLLAENEKLSRSNTAELNAERQRSEELAGKATSLESLVASMESEISSVRQATAAARQAEENRRLLTDEQRAQAKALADSGVPDKNRIAPAYPFGELKAKLELPVAGDILRQFGDADGTGHEAMGMTLATNPETVVTAPADGLIVYAGAFRSYGQMIILDAGDGYHLVLSGMETMNARQGKFVFAGEPLAVMGAKRVASATALALETNRPTLYIEFRKDGKPVDSRPWWTAKDTGKARNDS
ncbi:MULTISPECIES: murein hydrolase activator EnvC family protein [unclassified Rhizobium]|uniref:murein hydrolase activator EnvC family protein n=2 Tax=Rhizobium TaxID=379 RepID=UPI001ADCF841|nr:MULTISPECIES: murein hydrolase activator EnvC [unclassified Rhizobium]MBO9126157.1 murein hydrolase activator EnvC [Rhizobium sp. 16-488-2b]MBO9176741.1 murein hydrolase activator EnvC [Rhizobium sp. 16-488-2a]